MARKQQTKRLLFFAETFKGVVTQKMLPNAIVMFQQEKYNRGDIIVLKEKPLTKFYLIEDGEVGLMFPTAENPDKLKVINMNKIDFALTLTKNCMLCDEWVVGEPRNLYTAIALKQPTSLFSLTSNKFSILRHIIGTAIFDWKATVSVNN